MTTRDAWPPDLEMRVKTRNENGRTRLLYTLHSPTGVVALSHREIPGPALAGSPEDYQTHLLHKIEQLGHRLDIDGSALLRAEIDRKLASLGRDLWRELFPPEFLSIYRKIRQSAVRSWMIVSDEPWIPWELIKPYDDSHADDILDDDFLIFQFELTRWLAGEKTPSREIRVRSLAALRTATDLPQAKQEQSLLTKIAESPHVIDATPDLDSAVDLLSYLGACEVDLIHFVGHGKHTAGRADESGIPLPDGSVFRPVDLEGPVATHISRNRPLVFLNACWAGQQGWSLSSLGGWASRWVAVCGCGAFVAPMWPVRDKAALAFAWAFYDALVQGFTFGEAALAARRHVRKERPGDPSVLAYTVYGHPNARLRFGVSSVPGENPSEEERRAWSPQWQAPRRSPSLRSISLAAGCGLVAVLTLTAEPIRRMFLPFDQSPAQISQITVPAPPPAPAGEPTPVSPGRKPLPAASSWAVSVSVGGLHFKIIGGQFGVNYALKQALQRAAQPLVEKGVSGWSFTLALDAPRLTPSSQGDFMMTTCHLTGRVTVERQGSPLDLGRINVKNAQFDESGCEAAAESFADTVVSRFTNEMKGES